MIYLKKSTLCYILFWSSFFFYININAQNYFDADFESGTLGGYTAYHGEISNDGVVIFPNQNVESTQHRIMNITDGFDPIADDFHTKTES